MPSQHTPCAMGQGVQTGGVRARMKNTCILNGEGKKKNKQKGYCGDWEKVTHKSHISCTPLTRHRHIMQPTHNMTAPHHQTLTHTPTYPFAVTTSTTLGATGALLGPSGASKGASGRYKQLSRNATSGGDTRRGTRANRCSKSLMHVSKCTSPAYLCVCVCVCIVCVCACSTVHVCAPCHIHMHNEWIQRHTYTHTHAPTGVHAHTKSSTVQYSTVQCTPGIIPDDTTSHSVIRPGLLILPTHHHSSAYKNHCHAKECGH